MPLTCLNSQKRQYRHKIHAQQKTAKEQIKLTVTLHAPHGQAKRHLMMRQMTNPQRMRASAAKRQHKSHSVLMWTIY